MSLYEYYDASPKANLKYIGAVASGYDAKRMDDPKWQAEQEIIESMLSEYPQGTWILDAPCGTGRWLDICKAKGFIYRGLDISEDMIKQAAAKLGNQTPIARFNQPDGSAVEVPQFSIAQGNVLSTGIPDKAADVAVNCRITRWLSPQECQQMFTEMQRVARRAIIMTARVADHQHMRPLQMFEAVMSPDWRLADSVAGYQPQYRVFRFRHDDSGAERPVMEAEKSEPSGDDSWTMKPYEGA